MDVRVAVTWQVVTINVTHVLLLQSFYVIIIVELCFCTQHIAQDAGMILIPTLWIKKKKIYNDKKLLPRGRLLKKICSPYLLQSWYSLLMHLCKYFCVSMYSMWRFCRVASWRRRQVFEKLGNTCFPQSLCTIQQAFLSSQVYLMCFRGNSMFFK